MKILLLLSLLFSQSTRIPKIQQVSTDDLLRSIGELHTQVEAQSKYIVTLQNIITELEKEKECEKK